MIKTSAINYKLRYTVTSDRETKYLKDSSKKQALSIFAKSRKIRTTKFKNFSDWN